MLNCKPMRFKWKPNRISNLMPSAFVYILITLTLLPPTSGAHEKILLINQPISPSHVRLMHKIGKQLSRHGHELTELRYTLTESVAAIPTPTEFTRMDFTWGREPERVRALSGYIDSWAWMDQDTMHDVIKLTVQNTILNPDFPNLVHRWVDTSKLLIEPCLELHYTSELRLELIRKNFTMAIMDPVAFPCAWVLLNHLNIPYLLVSNFVEFYELDHSSGYQIFSGVPVPFSYVSASSGATTDHMSFVQRAINVPMHYLLDIVHSVILLPLANALAGQFTSPIVSDTQCRPVATLVNGQRFFDDFAKPVALSLTTFNLAGNGHAQRIGDDLNNFIDDPQSLGTIVLSMSTTTTSSTMTPNLQRSFIRAFSHSAAHSKTKVLITHGGINSIIEALSHSIPMIAIPMFGDQFPNAARLEARGVGKMLQKNEIALLPDTLTEVLRNDSYRARAAKVQRMIADQDRLPHFRDSSVFWIEFIGRHKKQVQRIMPNGHSLNHVSYFCLDIFAFLLVATLTAMLLLTDENTPLDFVLNFLSLLHSVLFSFTKTVRICVKALSG